MIKSTFWLKSPTSVIQLICWELKLSQNLRLKFFREVQPWFPSQYLLLPYTNLEIRFGKSAWGIPRIGGGLVIESPPPRLFRSFQVLIPVWCLFISESFTQWRVFSYRRYAFALIGETVFFFFFGGGGVERSQGWMPLHRGIFLESATSEIRRRLLANSWLLYKDKCTHVLVIGH